MPHLSGMNLPASLANALDGADFVLFDGVVFETEYLRVPDEDLRRACEAWGKAHLEEAKAGWIQRVNELPKILKPEQLQAARTWEPAKVAPTTRPAKATLTANPVTHK